MKTENSKKLQFYNLEQVRFIIKDACGIDVAYAYEDLVFSEHGLFILQFNQDTSTQIDCWFNKECIEKNKVNMFNSLAKSATLNGLNLLYKGKFEMLQKENSDEIDIQFEKG